MKCFKCGNQLHVGDWPYCPHGSTMSTRAQAFSPVVVFKDRKTGEYVFPGSATEKPPKNCEKIELTNSYQVRKFESEVNSRESGKRYEQLSRHRDRQHHLDQVRQGAREVLLHKMQSMSPRGREFARLAMKINDERRLSKPSFSTDPKFRVSAFHDNVSSGWKGKRVL